MRAVFAQELCMPAQRVSLTTPTAASTPRPVADLRHFQCYHVKRARTRMPDLVVTDQFGTFTVDVKRPLRLCNPVDKNGEGIADPAAHLMCYAVRTRTRPVGTTVFIDNQFGNDDVRVGKPREICVPSTKRLP